MDEPAAAPAFDPANVKVTADLGTTSAPQERKRRGRRPAATLNPTDPPGNGAPTGDAEPKQRRRRKAKPLDPLEVEKLAKQLKGIHTLIAMATGVQEMQLGETEAHMLAEAFATVSREYDVEFNGKTAATVQLIGTACLVYMPRLAVLTAKAKARKAAAPIDAEVVHGTAA